MDNPFFNVNSRGQSEYTKYNAPCVDRWYQNAASSSLNPKCTILSDGGVNFSADGHTNFVTQSINKLEPNCMYTLSILLKDGTIYSITCKGDNNRYIDITDGLQLAFRKHTDSNGMQIVIFNGYNFDILAAKLEVGEISTIHLDSAPDIETERLKCMMYTKTASDTYANKGAYTEDLWNSTQTYTVGSYCIWNGSMWKCLVENSGVTPVEGDTWTATSISKELASIISKIDALSA